MNGVVKKNLERMVGSKKGDMNPLIVDESMGGNAGFWHGFSCLAANFYYDPNSGLIQYFGNCQYVPNGIKGKFPVDTFRLAVDLERDGKCRIVDYSPPQQAVDIARQNLEETVDAYNKEYGFQLG